MRLTVWSYSGNVLRWQETYRLGICVQTGYADQDSSFGLSAAPWINASDNKLGMTKTGFLFFSSSQYSVFLFLLLSHSVTSNSLQPWGLQPARLLCPWDAPGKNTGVSWHFLLQGFFLTKESNPSLLDSQASALPLTPWEASFKEQKESYTNTHNNLKKLHSKTVNKTFKKC